MRRDEERLRISRRELRRAMQRLQDFTYLDEANHRYHCGGGSCADRLWEHLLTVADDAKARVR